MSDLTPPNLKEKKWKLKKLFSEQQENLTWESCWLNPLNWGAKRASFDLNILGATGVAPGAHNFLIKSPKAKAISPWPRSKHWIIDCTKKMQTLKRQQDKTACWKGDLIIT